MAWLGAAPLANIKTRHRVNEVYIDGLAMLKLVAASADKQTRTSD